MAIHSFHHYLQHQYAGGKSPKFPLMETNRRLFPSEYRVAIQKGKDAMNCFGWSEKKARWKIKKESKNIYIFYCLFTCLFLHK